MIVDHNHRYIFVSVPKTGSISVQFSLGYGHDVPEPDLYHQGISSVLALNQECCDYFKFAFVRNPWARIHSLYQDFTKNRVDRYSALVRCATPLLSEFRDFNDLCVRLVDSPWQHDVFFLSQTQLLSMDGTLVMDYIGRFEQLSVGFAEICRRIGVTPELQRLNVGKYDNSGYRSHFNDAARMAVANFYRADVENFGYEF